MEPTPDSPGDAAGQPAEALFAEVYARLKAMAARQLAVMPKGGTLETTALVHELYLRMSSNRELLFGHRAQFFAYAARAMRHLLVDLARRRQSLKEGGDLARIGFTDPAVGAVSIEPALALELDTALNALAADSPRAAQVVELHYFAGLPLPRVAEVTGLSSRTVDRDWQYARAFLSTHAGS
jgi:RNA polymerase sigma factor (TIGR02999 family)